MHEHDNNKFSVPRLARAISELTPQQLQMLEQIIRIFKFVEAHNNASDDKGVQS